ncbi:dienelactone hydrolase family protein [Streptomyces sp. NBC_00490]|uniref:dienelactone hydrolase family protein n=1 Tax=Streptomyces sp. NBC_00490 TaxID=2903657 RepID=UPI002E18F0B9
MPGVGDGGWVTPGGGGSDAFGLRPRLKGMAERLASAGYTVLVPNVFHRSGRGHPWWSCPTSSTRRNARRSSRASARPTCLDWLARSPPATDGKVGVTGYCVGAGLALRTAGTHPDPVAAAAGFHGAFLATDAPGQPPPPRRPHHRRAPLRPRRPGLHRPGRPDSPPRPGPHHGGRPPPRRGDGLLELLGRTL